MEEGYLSAAQALNKFGKIVPHPKTRAGFRSIDLPDEVIDALIKHKVKIEEQKRKAGDLYHDLDLVKCTADGKLIDRKNLSRTFKSLIEKAGLPDIRFHDAYARYAIAQTKCSSQNRRGTPRPRGHTDDTGYVQSPAAQHVKGNRQSVRENAVWNHVISR